MMSFWHGRDRFTGKQCGSRERPGLCRALRDYV